MLLLHYAVVRPIGPLPSPPVELIARRRTAGRSGALIPVAKDHPALLEVVWRHFDRYAVAGKGLYPILLHSSRGVGDQRVTVVKLNAIAGVWQNLGDETLELQKLFFRQFTILWSE
jgi:hypothetical protein